MHRPRWEVADVIRRYGDSYRKKNGIFLPVSHQRVLTDIENCRTAILGGHVEACQACGVSRISYNSCRNRHCPKCQSRARKRWIEQRVQELLPVEYFHVVFTVPQEIAQIALHNRVLFYNLLFSTTAKTLKTIARDPKHLGAEIGFLAVLHSWGQKMNFHPHIHCIVPGGGFAPSMKRWVPCRKSFLLPVRVLSRFFRGAFIKALEKEHRKGNLEFHESLKELREEHNFGLCMEKAGNKDWVVYAKKPFAGPEVVLKYLGRYTHRIAISNSRILDIEDGKVRFKWRDYRRGNKNRETTLAAEEFIRRFLLHVLPTGFVRVRHFGFLANNKRTHNILTARELIRNTELHETNEQGRENKETPTEVMTEDITGKLCPDCKEGWLVRIRTVPPVYQRHTEAENIDSS